MAGGMGGLTGTHAATSTHDNGSGIDADHSCVRVRIAARAPPRAVVPMAVCRVADTRSSAKAGFQRPVGGTGSLMGTRAAGAKHLNDASASGCAYERRTERHLEGGYGGELDQ